MKNPIQPITVVDGVARFKANKIVCRLLDFATSHGFGMNEIACLDVTADDRQQFAQLIGYSASGYESLSYVDAVAYETAARVNNEGLSELHARLKTLEHLISALKEGLREPIAVLFEIHPDDLGGDAE